jgi:hypothetical protein
MNLRRWINRDAGKKAIASINAYDQVYSAFFKYVKRVKDYEESVGIYSEKIIELAYTKIKIVQVSNSNKLLKPYNITNRAACWFCEKCKSNSEDIGVLNENLFIIKNTQSIFSEHFFIADIEHFKKIKSGNIFQFLRIAQALSNNIILSDGWYLPDKQKKHDYFHVLPKRTLPIELEYNNIGVKKGVFKSNFGEVALLDFNVRSGLFLQSTNIQWLISVFFEIEKLLGRAYFLNKFPYLNLISWYEEQSWILILLPRVVQRPHQYYEEEANRLGIDFGVIEVGGVITVQYDHDFIRLDEELIKNIYSQVCFGYSHLKECVKPLGNILLNMESEK